jgi:hypothetical protein
VNVIGRFLNLASWKCAARTVHTWKTTWLLRSGSGPGRDATAISTATDVSELEQALLEYLDELSAARDLETALGGDRVEHPLSSD